MCKQSEWEMRALGAAFAPKNNIGEQIYMRDAISMSRVSWTESDRESESWVRGLCWLGMLFGGSILGMR